MEATTRLALTGSALAIAALTPATRVAAQRPDLSGQWTYNAAQSGNPRDMIEGDSAAGERRGGESGGSRGGYGGRRGGFGGRGRFGGRGGEGGGGMSDEQRARMHQTMQLVLQTPSALTIVESDSTVTLTADTGAALPLYGDGRKVKETVEGGGDIEIKGRWQGNAFVVERKVSGGGKVTEDYLRSPDGKQLFVIVNFEGSRGRALTFRRVYDAAAS